MTDLVRELRDEYPAVDVTTVVFSRDFAGIGYCVIPQERVLAVIGALEGRDALVKALEEIAKGQGAFSRDPLTHASNTIDDMKGLAREALAKAKA